MKWILVEMNPTVTYLLIPDSWVGIIAQYPYTFAKKIYGIIFI